MSRQSKSGLTLLLGSLACLALLAGLHASDDPKTSQSKSATSKSEAPATAHLGSAVKPKPLSDNVKKALAYLAGQQHADGGWGQGGGWRVADQGGRIEGANVQDPSDVANTCMAALALLRAGNTPKTGPYANHVANAIEFICGHVGKADKDSLYVTTVRGTQVQSKIGPFVDTFLTALVLAEVKGQMPEEQAEKKLVTSLQKTVSKIEKHQQADGTFAGNNGWASIFSQCLACKGLNRASQAGLMVDPQALVRAENNAVAGIDVRNGTFKTASPEAGGSVAFAGLAAGRGAGLGGAARPALAVAAAPAGAPSDAGVRLYNDSNFTAALQESVNTGKVQEKRAREILDSKASSKKDKEQAKENLLRIAKVEVAQQVAVKAVVDQLGDKRFIQGFGSNGGEEFLSHLNISETLVVKGGKEWEKWDKSMSDNLNRIQNQDGSWSGDHCITGRTFCTASALLVLMADRTPIPMAAKMQSKK